MVRNKLASIEKTHPEVIEKIQQLPGRVKSAKQYEEHRISVLRKKGLSLFVQELLINEEENKVEAKSFEELLPITECKYEEELLPLTEQFWDGYKEIKDQQPKYKNTKQANSIEYKALKNLKVALKLFTDDEAYLLGFINVLIKDIKKYHVMGKYSLRAIGEKELSKTTNRNEFLKWVEEVKWLKRKFGEDYLDIAIAKAEQNKTEVIIAIENQLDK